MKLIKNVLVIGNGISIEIFFSQNLHFTYFVNLNVTDIRKYC